MFQNWGDLKSTIESFNESMSAAKRKLRNVALLRNICHLKPVLSNQTRWSGTSAMMERFVQIRDELVKVSEHEDGDLVVNKTKTFMKRSKKYTKLLSEINEVTLSLQEEGKSLADCRGALQVLIDSCKLENSALYNSKLSTKYIGERAKIVKYPDFETGVVKLQERRVN